MRIISEGTILLVLFLVIFAWFIALGGGEQELPGHCQPTNWNCS
jgi:hypothetical protein